MMQDPTSQNQVHNPFEYSTTAEIKEYIYYFLRNWKWFLLGIFLLLTAAKIYLRYAVPQYQAKTTLLLKDDQRNSMDPSLAVFSDLGIFSNIKTILDNEIEVLHSRTLIKNTVNQLGFNIFYINEGKFKSEELYKTTPFQMVFEKLDESVAQGNFSYKIIGLDQQSFELFDHNSNSIGKFTFGQKISVPQGTIVFFSTKNFKTYIANPFVITCTYHPLDDIADHYRSLLTISKISDKTSVVELGMVNPIKEKAEDFLNALIRVYNHDVVEDKNMVFENTSRFIDDRLKLIADELDSAEKTTENFKVSNNLTDISSEANLFLSNASDFEKREIQTETQIKVVETMRSFLGQTSGTELIPANIISSEANASVLINEYNALVLDKKRLMKNAGPKNSVVLQMDSKIDDLKANIFSSLDQMTASLEVERKDLAYQNAMYKGKITKIPSLERKAKNLGRQQSIKESLYLYLFQKREETALSLAVTIPNAKVIDVALASKTPVAPLYANIYLLALALGILFPAVILYLVKISDNKIKTKKELESLIKIPVVGEIPKSDLEDSHAIQDSNSSVSEALRMMRSNLKFIIEPPTANRAQILAVTSTLPNEGKTFIAVNLAATIALTGKKVLLLGMDIRNPKIQDYIQVPAKGITNYLSDPNAVLADLCYHFPGYDHFDVMPSGPIPPNPAELLMNKKLAEMFEQLRAQYDYIIIDTSPMNLVADTQLISEHMDAFLYVVRSNYLDRDMLHVPHKLYHEKKLKNMSILLNDVEAIADYYTYGYYGQRKKPKSRLAKILDKIKKAE